jgi:hypothetical protein
MENTETYDQSDEADEISREDLSEPKHSLSSPSVSEPPEVDGLISPSVTHESEPTPGVTTNPPSDVSRRFSTDTVAQQVPDFDVYVKAEVPATGTSIDVQADLEAPQSQHYEMDDSLDAALIVSNEEHQQGAEQL